MEGELTLSLPSQAQHFVILSRLRDGESDLRLLWRLVCQLDNKAQKILTNEEESFSSEAEKLIKSLHKQAQDIKNWRHDKKKFEFLNANSPESPHTGFNSISWKYPKPIDSKIQRPLLLILMKEFEDFTPKVVDAILTELEYARQRLCIPGVLDLFDIVLDCTGFLAHALTLSSFIKAVNQIRYYFPGFIMAHRAIAEPKIFRLWKLMSSALLIDLVDEGKNFADAVDFAVWKQNLDSKAMAPKSDLIILDMPSEMSLENVDNSQGMLTLRNFESQELEVVQATSDELTHLLTSGEITPIIARKEMVPLRSENISVHPIIGKPSPKHPAVTYFLENILSSETDVGYLEDAPYYDEQDEHPEEPILTLSQLSREDEESEFPPSAFSQEQIFEDRSQYLPVGSKSLMFSPGSQLVPSETSFEVSTDGDESQATLRIMLSPPISSISLATPPPSTVTSPRTSTPTRNLQSTGDLLNVPTRRRTRPKSSKSVTSRSALSSPREAVSPMGSTIYPTTHPMTRNDPAVRPVNPQATDSQRQDLVALAAQSKLVPDDRTSSTPEEALGLPTNIIQSAKPLTVSTIDRSTGKRTDEADLKTPDTVVPDSQQVSKSREIGQSSGMTRRTPNQRSVSENRPTRPSDGWWHTARVESSSRTVIQGASTSEHPQSPGQGSWLDSNRPRRKYEIQGSEVVAYCSRSRSPRLFEKSKLEKVVDPSWRPVIQSRPVDRSMYRSLSPRRPSEIIQGRISYDSSRMCGPSWLGGWCT